MLTITEEQVDKSLSRVLSDYKGLQIIDHETLIKGMIHIFEMNGEDSMESVLIDQLLRAAVEMGSKGVELPE